MSDTEHSTQFKPEQDIFGGGASYGVSVPQDHKHFVSSCRTLCSWDFDANKPVLVLGVNYCISRNSCHSVEGLVHASKSH